MGTVKSRKLEESKKIILFSKATQLIWGIQAQLMSYSCMAWAGCDLSLYVYAKISGASDSFVDLSSFKFTLKKQNCSGPYFRFCKKTFSRVFFSSPSVWLDQDSRGLMIGDTETQLLFCPEVL